MLGLRLADKRSFPCPRRIEWTLARDELYEEIMTHAWNDEKKFFCQSYEDKEILDSSVLIMPLVFFCAGVRTHFISRLDCERLKGWENSRKRGSWAPWNKFFVHRREEGWQRTWALDTSLSCLERHNCSVIRIWFIGMMWRRQMTALVEKKGPSVSARFGALRHSLGLVNTIDLCCLAPYRCLKYEQNSFYIPCRTGWREFPS